MNGADGRRQQHRQGMDPQFVGYFVRLALLSVAAVAVVFAGATVLIVVVKPAPVWGLVIVAAAVVLAVAVLAQISRRLTGRFLRPGAAGGSDGASSDCRGPDDGHAEPGRGRPPRTG
ncbi:hypothetical protein [Tomitella cavernea]